MKQILMERAVLNPMADPAQWVYGWEGLLQTPECIYTLQCRPMYRQSDGEARILCVLTAQDGRHTELVCSWWYREDEPYTDRISTELSELMQFPVEMTWQL